MKRILITGASGFTGSHLVKAFEKESNIEIIANFRDEKKVPIWFKGKVSIGDLKNENYLNNLLENIDVICHCASWASLWGYEKESKDLYLNPTIKLIEKAKKNGVSKFINISTLGASLPKDANNPNKKGTKQKFWPHLCSVIEIEDKLREVASENFTAINLRFGLFIGENYSLGLLPILLPRLKTHLVPYIFHGKTNMHLIDGKDIAQAFVLATKNNTIKGYESFNIIGKSVSKIREVFEFLNSEFNYPKPHFNISFNFAYKFAFLTEKIASIFNIEPFITRGIIYLLEDREVDNKKAREILNFEPEVNWRNSVKKQILEIKAKNSNMKMNKDIIL